MVQRERGNLLSRPEFCSHLIVQVPLLTATATLGENELVTIEMETMVTALSASPSRAWLDPADVKTEAPMRMYVDSFSRRYFITLILPAADLDETGLALAIERIKQVLGTCDPNVPEVPKRTLDFRGGLR